MKKLFPLIVGILYITIANLCFANMSIDKAIVVFEPNASPREDVEIGNQGDDVLYIQVEVFEIKAPGTPSEERIQITNPDDIGLLVTPNKIIIPPHGHKLVRLVNLIPAVDEDRIYRIKFTPMVGPLQSDTIGVKVIVAYGILVIVQPPSPDPQLEVIRNGKQLTVKNKGNTNALFQDGTQCPEDKTLECLPLASKRVYAGTEWTTDLPQDQTANYYVTVGTKTKKRKYP